MFPSNFEMTVISIFQKKSQHFRPLKKRFYDLGGGLLLHVASKRGDDTLTEVEDHAGEDNEPKPDTEVGGEVDDGDDDVADGGEDAEQDVARRRRQRRECDRMTVKSTFRAKVSRCTSAGG